MQLDDQTANSVVTRPVAAISGPVRWFRPRDLGGGITGTTMEADFLNDQLGNNIDLFAAAGITRTKGAAGDSDLLDAIKAIQGINSSQSTLDGELFRTGDGIIQLRPRVGNDIAVGIDNKVLRLTGVLSFNMAIHLEGSENPSTPYYLYVKDSAGSFSVQISATVPDLPGGTKPGFKTGDATRRCIGSTYNNLASHFVKGNWGPGGVFNLAEHDADHEATLATAASTSWQTDSELDDLNIPHCATSVLIAASIGLSSGDGMICYGSDAAAGTLTAGEINPGAAGSGFRHVIVYMINSGAGGRAGAQCSGEIPILTPTVPKIKFGITSNQDSEHHLIVTGWRDMFAPR